MSQQQTLLRVETNIASETITGATEFLYLDLYDEIPIKINKSFAELQDIASRNSDYSVNLLLPGSKKNNRFFESFYDVDIDSFNFNANFRVECRIILDSKTLFKGYLRLNKVNVLNSKVEYDVTLYSTVGDLYGKIGNNLLKDLDFNDPDYTFNHTFTFTGVTQDLADSNFFQNNVKPIPYFYPIVHNGYNYVDVSGTTLPDFSGLTVSRRTRLYTPTTPISGWTTLAAAYAAGVDEYYINSPTQALYDNQLKPALNIYSLIQLIFKTYGYTITSDFMNTPWMKTLYMYGYFSSDATKFGYKINNIENLPLEGVQVIFIPSGSTIVNAYVAKRETGVPCYCLSDIQYRVDFTDGVDTYTFDGVIPNGTTGTTVTQPSYTYVYGVSYNTIWSDNPNDLKYLPAPIGSSIAFFDGDPVNFSLIIDENIKQIDLLSSIAKKFNLVFVPNPDNPRDIIIEPFDFYVGTGDVWDWTDKISYDKGFSVQPALNFVESELVLTDQEDGDEGNREFKIKNNRIYGVNKVPNPTDFKSETKTIQTLFSPQIVRQWDNDAVIGLPLGINYSASSQQSSYDNQVRWVYSGVKTKPKLFFWLMGLNPFIDSVNEVYDTGVYNTYTIKMQNSTGGTASNFDRIPSISHTMPMGLADNLKINNDSLSILFNSEQTLDYSVPFYNTYTENDAYNTFYKNRITNIYNPNTRFVNGKFNLSFSDISNLKPNDVIKLKQQYFIVNKINEFNYVNTELTDVELLQFNVNPQNYPDRYFQYSYCQNPSTCFVFKTDFTNPNLRQTNFIWSLYYDNQVGSLTGSTTGFTSSFRVLDLEGAIEEFYIPYTMKEITEAEYNASSCYNICVDPVMNYIYENPNGLIYSLTGFWNNSGYTKTGINVWENCASFYSDASTYGILTGNTASYGPAGYSFNELKHFNGTASSGSTANVREIQMGRNGALFVGGGFSWYNGVALGSSRNNFVKLYNNSVLNTGFSHISIGLTNSIEIDPVDDKLYVGSFSGYLKFNTDGTTDTSFNGGVNGAGGTTTIVYDVEILEDGTKETLIGGAFSTYNGTNRVGIARITTGGTLNSSFVSYFTTGVTFTTVRDIDVFNSGTYVNKIVAVGAFTQYSGQSRNGIVVLNPDGTLFTTFNPGTGFSGDTQQVYTFNDGTMLVSAGALTSYNGTAVTGMVKLNIDGSLNTGFTFNIPPYLTSNNDYLNSFDLQSDGKIIASYVNQTNGNTYLIRLNTDGSFDNSFSWGYGTNIVNPQNMAENIYIAADDTIYFGGSFRYYTVGSTTKEVWSIVKLDKDGNYIDCPQPVIPATPTPTPTPSPTPTATPTATPTSTPTSTPTITPTPVCTCYYHNAVIGQADLDVATGNTLTFRNNKVYTGYFDCNGNEAFKAYDTAGTYTNDLCPNGIPVNVYYWRDDVATPASVSSVVNTGVCCTVPTPTPTTTPTPTPTSTPTPTPTATPSPIGQCYCYEIWVTGTTTGEGTIASIEYNDCYGVLTARAFTVGPLIYKQCIQTLGGVVQYFTSNGVDTSKIVIPGTGNCNTGFDCSGSEPIPPTPTPSPTPTATNTPTPTATNTPTPTATPFQTTFSGYVSLIDGPSACAGGEYGTVNVTVQGTSLCNLTKVLGLSSTTYGNVYADMIANDTFWVSDGTDEREFLRDGSAQTGTAQTACTACSAPPTPTPTPQPPTPTPTPGPLTTYTGCGYGNTGSSACNDAANNRTLYSDCDALSLGAGCFIYYDTFPNALTGYSFVFIGGILWDVNSSTGQIISSASEQC